MMEFWIRMNAFLHYLKLSQQLVEILTRLRVGRLEALMLLLDPGQAQQVELI